MGKYHRADIALPHRWILHRRGAGQIVHHAKNFLSNRVLGGVHRRSHSTFRAPHFAFAAQGVERLNAPVAGGSFLATLLLFIVPVTLLGCVSPFAIRLSSNNLNQVGNSAGRIYAISTLGSLVGTFLPVLVLIPTLGTNRTYLFLHFCCLDFLGSDCGERIVAAR